MKLDDLYREVILDHHQSPRGKGIIANPNTASAGFNPTCGDEVSVHLHIAGDRIEEIQVKSRGCAISTAAGSMLAEVAGGMTTSALKEMAKKVREMLKTGETPDDSEMGDLPALQGVSQFPQRVKCAMLPVVTALQALELWEDKRGDDAVTTE